MSVSFGVRLWCHFCVSATVVARILRSFDFNFLKNLKFKTCPTKNVTVVAIFSCLKQDPSEASRQGTTKRVAKRPNTPTFCMDERIRLATMMKLALVTALVASASAFSPAASVQKASALSASPYESEIGVVPPVSSTNALLSSECPSRTFSLTVNPHFTNSSVSLTPWASCKMSPRKVSTSCAKSKCKKLT